jgi:hypothetical protein
MCKKSGWTSFSDLTQPMPPSLSNPATSGSLMVSSGNNGHINPFAALYQDVPVVVEPNDPGWFPIEYSQPTMQRLISKKRAIYASFKRQPPV